MTTPRRRAPAGFTLLELLLAAALSSVLLAALWSLFSMYGRLFTTAETRVEQAQLARALAQQLSDDLHAAIPDVSPNTPGASAAVRRFGLFGTREALQVDVLQVTGAQASSEAQGDELSKGPRRPVSQVPELHTVRYTFQGTSEGDFPGGETPSGLVRRELDWETPAADEELPVLPEGSDNEEKREVSIGGEFAGSGIEDLLAISGANGSATWAPEVVGLEFRYFDGSGWSDQWNSLTRKSLPVAVEAVLRVKALGESPRPAARADNGEFSDEETTPTSPGPPPANVETHRVLVYLPSTGLEYGPKKPEVGPRPITVPVAQPLLPPAYHAPLPPPRAPAGQPNRNLPLSDQWMRSGS